MKRERKASARRARKRSVRFGKGASRRPVVREAAQLSLVDLFCGAGGIAEGFRQAGFRVLAGSDSDPDAMATFGTNFPEAEPIAGDIRRADVRERIISAAAAADVVVGGPPCQAFSQVRNHTRVIDDPRNALYGEFVQVVRRTSPLAFVMENVTGIDQMGVRAQMVTDLSLDGEYAVLAQVLDAADFGVPQTRKRLLFIGMHRSLGCEPPRLSGSGATGCVALVRFAGARGVRYEVLVQESILGQRIGDALQDSDDLSVVTAEQAISDLESLPVGHRLDQLNVDSLPPAQSRYQEVMRAGRSAVLRNVQVPRIRPDTVLRLKHLPHGGNYRDLEGPLRDRYITGARWGQDNGSGRLSRLHFYAYRRLHPRVWAWTLNTKADSVYHYDTPRALSVREFARLQSFPDRFVFCTDPRKGVLPGRIDGGAAHSRYRQAGNAVPPLLAAAVGSAVREAIVGALKRKQARMA
jgi:DNA (cytosine-5)-methyltransferase 1